MSRLSSINLKFTLLVSSSKLKKFLKREGSFDIFIKVLKVQLFSEQSLLCDISVNFWKVGFWSSLFLMNQNIHK